MTVTVTDTLSSGTPIGVVPAATSMSETVCIWHHSTAHPFIYIYLYFIYYIGEAVYSQNPTVYSSLSLGFML